MEIEQILKYRSSIRKYNEKVPSAEMIQKVVDSALLAPIVRLHKFQINVVTNKEIMQCAEKAAKAFFKSDSDKKFMYNAPVWIILSGEKHNDEDLHARELLNNNLYWNVGSIIECMELQAVSLGLASCAMNATIVSMTPEIKNSIGIPENFTALGSIIIGYNDDAKTERVVKTNLIPVSYVK